MDTRKRNKSRKSFGTLFIDNTQKDIKRMAKECLDICEEKLKISYDLVEKNYIISYANFTNVIEAMMFFGIELVQVSEDEKQYLEKEGTNFFIIEYNNKVYSCERNNVQIKKKETIDYRVLNKSDYRFYHMQSYDEDIISKINSHVLSRKLQNNFSSFILNLVIEILICTLFYFQAIIVQMLFDVALGQSDLYLLKELFIFTLIIITSVFCLIIIRDSLENIIGKKRNGEHDISKFVSVVTIPCYLYFIFNANSTLFFLSIIGVFLLTLLYIISNLKNMKAYIYCIAIINISIIFLGITIIEKLGISLGFLFSILIFNIYIDLSVLLIIKEYILKNTGKVMEFLDTSYLKERRVMRNDLKGLEINFKSVSLFLKSENKSINTNLFIRGGGNAIFHVKSGNEELLILEALSLKLPKKAGVILINNKISANIKRRDFERDCFIFTDNIIKKEYKNQSVHSFVVDNKNYDEEQVYNFCEEIGLLSLLERNYFDLQSVINFKKISIDLKIVLVLAKQLFLDPSLILMNDIVYLLDEDTRKNIISYLCGSEYLTVVFITKFPLNKSLFPENEGIYVIENNEMRKCNDV